MTAKRFSLGEVGCYRTSLIVDDDGRKMGNKEVVDVLNDLHKENMQLQEELDYYKTKCGSLETALLQGRRAVDKEKEQRMFLVDMEKQRKMFR